MKVSNQPNQPSEALRTHWLGQGIIEHQFFPCAAWRMGEKAMPEFATA